MTLKNLYRLTSYFLSSFLPLRENTIRKKNMRKYIGNNLQTCNIFNDWIYEGEMKEFIFSLVKMVLKFEIQYLIYISTILMYICA